VGLSALGRIWDWVLDLKQWPVAEATDKDWVKGNPDAEVVIVEYADLQCPACKLYSSVMSDLAVKYASEAAFVYRHFPLKQIHLQAVTAAHAAEAAGLQGKFWEMHDKLFETQELWSNNRGAKNMFADYAGELGLDVERFKRDMNSKEVRAKVEAHYLNGLENRLNSTPSFFINGERIENPQGLEAFSQLIDQKLIEATASGNATTE
jgi:protein-disulfide isomerase